MLTHLSLIYSGSTLFSVSHRWAVLWEGITLLPILYLTFILFFFNFKFLIVHISVRYPRHHILLLFKLHIHMFCEQVE